MAQVVPITVNVPERPLLNALREQLRCWASTRGALEAINADLPADHRGRNELATLTEGGIPEAEAVIRSTLREAGALIDETVTAKSFHRGFQTVILLRLEGAGHSIGNAWAQDPEVFYAEYWARRNAGLCLVCGAELGDGPGDECDPELGCPIGGTDES